VLISHGFGTGSQAFKVLVVLLRVTVAKVPRIQRQGLAPAIQSPRLPGLTFQYGAMLLKKTFRFVERDVEFRGEGLGFIALAWLLATVLILAAFYGLFVRHGSSLSGKDEYKHSLM
jgi:hypothetical protein